MTADAPAAVFLDRDGVINANLFYADTGEIEAPRRAADFALLPGVLPAIRRLQDAGYVLFIVSNQPNQAKHKASRADHDAIQMRLETALASEGISIADFYYCFHHPQSVDPVLGGPCVCRKPAPYFLFQARDRRGIVLERSWMIGDRATDVECGRQAGVRTILIAENATSELAASAQPDFVARDLVAAAELLLKAAL